MYLALFKTDGERYTSLVQGIHFDDTEGKQKAIEKCRQEAAESGYEGELLAVDISDADQELYQTNAYIRNMETGEPMIRPPYVPPIAEFAASTWTAVKVARDAAEQSGCPYMGKTLDSDSTSVQRISIAVQAAQGALAAGVEGFVLDWTMQDNSIVAMTAEQVIGMSAALAAYSNELHERARVLREQIEQVVADYKAGVLAEDDARAALAAIKFGS